MSEPPRHLLEHLASIEEQRRYVVDGGIDEYLLPEEMLHDALRFCERMESADLRDTLTGDQRAVLGRLKDAVARLSGCVERYDRTNSADLIEKDIGWAVIRRRAGEALEAFEPAPPG